MGLDEWATEQGYRQGPLSFNQYMATHPEVAAEVIAARNQADPWTYEVIAEWLTEDKGFPTSESSVRKWVRRNV